MKLSVLRLAVLFVLPKWCINLLKRKADKREKLRWSRMVFPLIEAAFPSLVACDLISVQPMQAPRSTVFHMDFIKRAPTHDPVALYLTKVKRGYDVDKPAVIFLKQHD
jgi:hypothetical protein